ncbi:FRIGIDA-like protein 5 [Pyrus x bretschneideri]|uniref:FRIGIDA-like protein 5 n=1 Tax=Pyrus x bretschneideri TaxID=225117 RepID=UPI00202F8C0C|nr:FRIGIDA-like protein 5 [Pyrus x bretschneideri]XP_048433076.1 FRIGIDA-like protein 5 [Pyrus x bretschneideri]XP_048433077.1 FRIGIDA-like protein 5 [Pyrus x bretschneideri]
MEDKGLKLKESELRQGKLALQFEGLLDCIDSTRAEILGVFQEVQDKDKKIGVLESQVEAKSEELRGIERLIEKRSNELESLESSLWDCQSSIEEHKKELSAKVKRLEEVQRWVSEKEREYDSIKKGIEHGRSKLNWYEKAVEKKSKLVESKEENLKGVLRTLEIYNEEIEFQKRRLNEIRGSIEEQKEELALKKEQTKEAERKVDQCDRETKDKEKKLSTIQKSIEEIESREKIIDAMDLKVKDFFLLKKSMEEWFNKLELKEKEFESKVADLSLIQKRVDECINEVQLKEQHLDSLEKLIREGKMHLDSQERLLKELSNGLELKETQLEQRHKELELKQEDIESIRNSARANSVIVSSSTSNHFSIDKDGGGLQLLMKESVKRIDLLSSELAAFLQASSDPAKLVLDAMQGFYPSNSIGDNEGFDYDLTVIRRSCVLLLQELKRLSPPINRPVREQAIKLVDDWKEKMTVVVENSLEVLGLLWLLTALELTSTYDARELQSLLALVSHPEHAPQLRQALGITYNASVYSALSVPVKIEEPEPSTVRNVATSPSPILQLSATATTDARNSQDCLDEHLSGNDSANNELLDVLRLPVDPEKVVLKLMQKSLDQYWSNRNVGFIANLKKTYIPMLNELMKISTNVALDVKEDAVKLAAQWQAKMRTDAENSWEILGFLQFVAAYGLLSTLSVDETVMLLGNICQNKPVLQLCRILSFADKIPGFIRDLIEGKQLIKAVRLICTFKLTDRFPPVVLLNKYVEDVRKSFRAIWPGKRTIYEKDNVMNNLIADMRGVLQCIKDHNLESEYPYKDIELEIVQLERLKENLRFLPTGIASRCEQQEQERRKRCSTSSTSQFQPPEKRQNRSHPTAPAAAARSYTTFRSQLNPSSQLFGNNDGHPGQFSMFANHHETGCSFVSEQLTSSSQLYENHGHPLQFAMDHEIGANFGPMQLRWSSQLAQNFGFPAPLPLASNEHEIGTDFSCMQDAGLYNSNQFLPGTHGFGRRET